LRRAPGIFASSCRTLRKGFRPRLIDVPLGTYLLRKVPFVPFEKRAFDVSYSGSRVTRADHAHRRVPTQKMRARRAVEAAVNRLATERPDCRVRTHIIDTFHDAPAHSAVYSQLLMDSRIVLCPRGGSLETYRFFEALCSGAVPVTERLPDRDYYGRAPGVRVRSWRNLTETVDVLLSDGEELRAQHEASLQWWAEKCHPEAVARRLIDALEA
jgi:hypothetical protein